MIVPTVETSAHHKLAYSYWPDQSEVTTFTSAISSASRWFYGTKRGAWPCKCTSQTHAAFQQSPVSAGQRSQQETCWPSSWQTVLESPAHMSIHALTVNPLPPFAAELCNQSGREALLSAHLHPTTALRLSMFAFISHISGFSSFAPSVVLMWD